MKTFNRDSIKVLRMTLGLSMDEFAKQINGTIQRQHIYNWENGVAVPNTDSLLQIVNAFNVPFDIFFSESGNHDESHKVSK